MIGKMRHTISVIEVVEDADFGFGQPNFHEVIKFTTRALVKEISRSDALSHGLNVEVSQYDVTIYNASGRNIKLDDKVRWNNERYQVRTSPSIVNLENRQFLKFIITREYGTI